MEHLRGFFRRETFITTDIKPFIEHVRQSRERADKELRESSKAVKQLKADLEPPFQRDMFPLDATDTGMG